MRLFSLFALVAFTVSFSFAGHVSFATDEFGEDLVVLTGRGGRVEISLRGAQVRSFTPTGLGEVFYRPPEMKFDGLKMVQGGIPICWPWFGRIRPQDKDTIHGYGRLGKFVCTEKRVTEELTQATLVLESGETNFAQLASIPSRLRLECDFILRAEGTLELAARVFNKGTTTCEFTGGFHPYWLVSDRRNVSIRGLDGLTFCDTTKSLDHRGIWQGALDMQASFDHVFWLKQPAFEILDPVLKRKIVVSCENTPQLVVWAPGSFTNGKFGGFPLADGYRFVCVEPVRIFRQNASLLEPNSSLAFRLSVKCEPASLPKQAMSVAAFHRRATRGDALTVVFYGCSLTWGANASDPETTSFRGRVMETFRRRYPKARWNFVNASIGGMTSHLGVFRLERDALAKNPDFLILDYTLNDGLTGGKEGLRDSFNGTYEAMIRRCLDDGVGVLPVILTRKEYTEANDIAFLKRRVEHQQMAAYYGLDCADVLGVLNADFKAGKMDTEVCWPKGMFDTCHPYDPGYAAYADAFFREWDRILDAEEKVPHLPHAWLSRPFTGLVRREAAAFADPAKGWILEMPYCTANTHDWLSSRWMDRLLVLGNGKRKDSFDYEPRAASQPFAFDFDGTYVALFVEVVKESVPFELEIDGKKMGTKSAGTAAISFCRNITLATGLPDGKHHVVIRPLLPQTGIGVVRIGSVLTAKENERDLGNAILGTDPK